jgi:hypothetical protein
MRAPSSHRLRSSLRLGGAAALALSIGCGTGETVTGMPASARTPQVAGATPDREHIVAVYRSHCGACHRPVAPGSEPSDRLQAELTIHHKRARLTEAEWAGLGAFLARP